MENQYEHKLALEMERYDALNEEMEVMRQRLSETIELNGLAHADQIKSLKDELKRNETTYMKKFKAMQEGNRQHSRKQLSK